MKAPLMNESIATLGQGLAEDVRAAASELKDTGTKAGRQVAESLRSAKQDLEPLYDKATVTVSEFGENLKQRFCDTAACTAGYLSANPWRSVGVAVIAGLLAGLYVSRSRRD